LIFIAGGLGHFSHQEIANAASQGVPIANILVPVSGIIAIVGGPSILLGFHGKVGAWLLVFFLVRVTFMMHNFWAVKRSHGAGDTDGYVPEEYFHAGRCTFLHASRNRPVEPRFPAWCRAISAFCV
jgi:uncharacterized membrane protein YphA (DoxX/SURF4 family)